MQESFSNTILINRGSKSSVRKIYVCHAFHDRDLFPEIKLKWAASFVEYLASMMKRISRRNYNICTSGNGVKTELDYKSTVFIFIIDNTSFQSHAFVEDLYFLKEHFSNVKPKAPLFKVMLSPIQPEVLPSYLASLPGDDFYITDHRLTIHNFLDGGIDSHGSRVFWDKLADIAYSIDNYFNTEEGLQVKDNSRATVYLAETTKDQTVNKAMVRHEIEQFGFRVLPENKLPMEAAELKLSVQEYILKSDCSVHILGQIYGDSPDGELHSVSDLQNKIAAEFARSDVAASKGFFRFIWIPSDLKVIDDLQKRFIEKIKENKENLFSSEIIVSSLEDFRFLLVKRLESLSRHKFLIREEEKVRKIYLIHEKRDFEKVKNIAEVLKRNGIQPVVSGISVNKSNLLTSHRQNLVESDAAIIIDSGTNIAWLKSKINDVRKAPGYGRKKPLAKAILISPETDIRKLNPLNDFIVFDYDTEIGQILQPIYENLTQDNE